MTQPLLTLLRAVAAAFVLCLLTAAAFPARAADPKGTDVDWDKARALYQRQQRGEPLSADELAYLNHAKEVRRQAQGGQGGGAAGTTPPPPPRESTGLVPLTQMTAEQSYKGRDGGLYGNGQNAPPQAHLKAALAAAAAVVPLDAAGKPAADGKIVLVSIGMSNTTMEFSRFKQIADADAAKNPKVLIVDLAQGGRAADSWNDLQTENQKQTWAEAMNRITRAGATAQQVQVVWIKQALPGPSRFGDFPKHSDALAADLLGILNQAKVKFPNLKLAYLSSRIYAGYATTTLNPEPYAYEGAFAVRDVIQAQVKGDAKLNYDPARGEVTSPVVLWGPYLWADGTKGRTIDKLTYVREDLGRDGTHPDTTGRQKVAELLLEFLKTDPTAKPWFTAGRDRVSR